MVTILTAPSSAKSRRSYAANSRPAQNGHIEKQPAEPKQTAAAAAAGNVFMPPAWKVCRGI